MFCQAPPSLQTPTQLYSGSYDRTLKLFDLATMGYVETLFGHQAPILSIDALRGETAVSVGGRDKTVRYWKVPEESQLVFRGGGASTWRDDLDGMDEDVGEDGIKKKAGQAADETSEKFVEGSIESVVMVDETTFVSGGDSGYVCHPFMRDGLRSYTHLGLDLSACGPHNEKSLYSHRRSRTGWTCRKSRLIISRRYGNLGGLLRLVVCAIQTSLRQVSCPLTLPRVVSDVCHRLMGRRDPVMEA